MADKKTIASLTIPKERILALIYEFAHEQAEIAERRGELGDVPACWVTSAYQGLEGITDVTVAWSDGREETP